VLPVVLAMSDEDAELLAEWVRAGGVLVAIDWAQTAIYDEDFVPRKQTAASLLGGSRCAVLEGLLAHPGKGAVRRLNKEMHRYAFQGYHDDADDTAIAAAMTPQAVTEQALVPPILTTSGLPRTIWANVWVHAAGNGPMRSIALVNYDGNASTNVLQPVAAPFTLSLRCDHSADSSDKGALGCKDVANASITCPGGTGTTALSLHRTDHGSYSTLNVTVPEHTITGDLGVVVFSAAREWGFRAASAIARKSLERLRIASRSKGLRPVQYQGIISDATTALRLAQTAPLTASALSSGADTFRNLATSLTGHLVNISMILDGGAEQSRAATVSAAANEATLLALATVPPLAHGQWQSLSTTSAFNASVGFGWTDLSSRSLVTSNDANQTDALHASFIGSTTPSTLRLQLPATAATGFVTIISGSFDQGRQSATTSVAVSGSAVTLPGAYSYSGVYRHLAFRFDRAAGTDIELTFSGSNAGHFYGDGYGQGLHLQSWLLNGVLVSSGSTPPTAQGRDYIALAEGLAETQLRHWTFIGPFDDAHFTARERSLGPEASFLGPELFL